MGAPRDESITFSGAGSQEVQYVGRHIRVRSTPTGPIFIKIDNSSTEFERNAGEQFNLGAGDPPFQRVRIRSAVAQTVDLTFADVPQDDNRSNVALSVSADITPAPVIDNGGDVSVPATSAADVLAGDADTLAVTVTSLETNDPSAPLRVGTTGVGAASGHPLWPGDSHTMATNATVRVYNPHGTAQDVAVLRLSQ
jgi:hypothetical protein